MAELYKFRALTDLWTGSINGKAERLIPTGLLGSVRWWFEVVVRGLGGSACDPSATKCTDKKHCVVCEFFGCTRWARKFRFEVLDEKNNVQAEQIEKGGIFIFRFTELRPVSLKEWTLLNATLRLIAEYGAIGGKTVLKPSDENDRSHKDQHKDYGLIQITLRPNNNQIALGDLKTYVSGCKWKKVRDHDFAWASLKNFWYVQGRYLSRQDINQSTFNRAIGRPEPKNQSKNGTDWLAGDRGVSKKVFSFKNPSRTFGFVKPGVISYESMKQRLENVWDGNGRNFLKGDNIIDRLFDGKGDCS